MVKVKVEQGWLEGEVLNMSLEEGKYYSFKGIPYAAPPLGKLRFKAPQPPSSWDGIRKATEHGPVCPQVDVLTEAYIPGDEDCLYLNVYSPNLKPELLLPVMVFIHGGGYKCGSGNDDEYGPEFLVNYEVVLVTINYRLEALGFLCLDTVDVPGNAGLKDQVAALQWVQKNIRNFGGNSKNVTIFGESAGSASTIFHILSPMSKGLFNRAIGMSGSPFCDWSFPYEPRRRAFKLGKNLGLETENADKLLEFLQNVSVAKLVNAKPNILSYEDQAMNIFKMYHFTPVIEKDFGHNSFIIEEPEEILKKGNINQADVIIGHTNDELLLVTQLLEKELLNNYNKYIELFIPRQLYVRKLPKTALDISEKIKKHFLGNKPIDISSIREFLSYLNESSITYGVRKAAKLLPKQNGYKRFFYIFSCFSDRNVYGKLGAKYDTGAAHKDDLMYLFNTSFSQFSGDKNSPEYKMINQTCTLFTNFAKFGNPTPDSKLGVVWPEYDSDNEKYLDIGDALTVGKSLDPETTKFWDGVFETKEI